MTHSSETEFVWDGPNGKVVALGILVICPVDKNPDSKTKIEFWSQYIILGQNCTFSFLRSFRPIGSPPVNVFNMKEVSHRPPDLRVPKILLLPSNNGNFGPKTAKFGPKLTFLAKYRHFGPFDPMLDQKTKNVNKWLWWFFRYMGTKTFTYSHRN